MENSPRIARSRVPRILTTVILCLSFTACQKRDDLTPSNSLSEVSTYVTYAPYVSGITYQDGPVGLAQFYDIEGIAFDTNDNLYIADLENNRIRKVSADGKIVSTFAGSGVEDLIDGVATTAAFDRPTALTFDGIGNLYATQPGAVRKITSDGTVTTVVGTILKNTPNPLDSVELINPYGITVDNNQNIYVTSYNSIDGRVTKITPNQKVSSFAGIPFKTYYPTTPKIVLNAPNGIGFNPITKKIYIVDALKGVIEAGLDGTGGCISGCQQLYKHQDGTIATATFQIPSGGIFDRFGNFYMGDENYIRKITPDGVVSTIAGTGKIGSKDGPGNQAEFNKPALFCF